MKASRLLILSSFFVVSLAYAADNGAYVPVREAYMRALGGHAGAIGGILKGKIDAPDQILAHAQAMESLSKFLTEGFPKDSNVGKSEAKPEVWKNWDDFKKKASEFQDATTKLVDAAKTKDMAKIGPAMGAVGDSCKSCHKTFKKPDK